MLSVKQDSIKYHFLSLSYDSTWERKLHVTILNILIYTHLSGIKYFYLILIIFNQNYLIYLIWDQNRYFHFGSEWTWKYWKWKGTLHFPELQNRSLTIPCSLVSISCGSCSLCSTNFSRVGCDKRLIFKGSNAGFNLKFSLYESGCTTEFNEPSLPNYFSIERGQIDFCFSYEQLHSCLSVYLSFILVCFSKEFRCRL